jgi:hypothetical protein
MLMVSQIVNFLSNVGVADQGQWFWRLGPDSTSREYQRQISSTSAPFSRGQARKRASNGAACQIVLSLSCHLRIC